MKQWDRKESARKGKRTRKMKIANILKNVPETLAADLINLMVAGRYAQALLENPSVKRYVNKYHPDVFTTINGLLADMGL